MDWMPFAFPADGLVSIVIPVYNQAHYTKDCLAGVRDLTLEPHEIIVVDNGSADETPDLLDSYAREGLPLRTIRNDKNLGFTLAANQGMRAAIGDYILLLNNDVTVTPHWLFGLLRMAQSADDIGIVGPRILDPRTGQIKTIGGLVFRKGGVQAPPGENCPREEPAFTMPLECQYAEGSCMLIKRAVVDAIGCLDESFAPAYYEDVDYCFRAREAGFRVVYSPYSEIYHYSTVTAQAVQREDNEFTRASHRNDRKFRERWAHRFW
jgi:GT2 family glycosyltransferase